MEGDSFRASRARRSRGRAARRTSRSLLVALGGTLLLAGVALAAVLGLQNPSFENGLDHWEVKTVDGDNNRAVVYGPGGSKGTTVPGCDAPDAYGICVTGQDQFEVSDENGTRTVTVNPLDGSKMLRLAGPFHNDDENQADEHIFVAEQTFTVDPANPVLKLNYNLFTFDYSGFDELRLVAKVSNESGQVVEKIVQGGFGPDSDTSLKTTGWRGAPMDLSPYANQQMHLSLELQGTTDDLYGSWGYFDAGTAPVPPVSAQGSKATAPQGVEVNKFIDPSTGLVYFGIANSQLGSFPNGMPLTLDFPINAGAATLSNVTLRFRDQEASMTNVGGNVWRGQLTINAFEGGQLVIEYDATEGSQTEHYFIPVGGITLIDPQGVVYDKVQFVQARVNGASAATARANAAIAGAVATLQRQGTGGFLKVLSADPGIDPNVNPETTGANGKFQWDVSAGTYRVVVTRSGYKPVISPAVNIPPPVLDLHIALDPCSVKTGKAQQQCLKRTVLLSACIGKTGTNRSRCVRFANARANCELKSGIRKRRCIALSRCQLKTGKRKRRCVRRASKIGRN